MTIAASIIAILAAAVPFLVWYWRRRIEKKDDPQTQNTRRREEIAREIARDDERGANRRLDDDLDRLRALQSDQRRSAGPSHENRQ